jgi:hypothetical protein
MKYTLVLNHEKKIIILTKNVDIVTRLKQEPEIILPRKFKMSQKKVFVH